MTKYDVIIVGAGIFGLSTAVQFGRAGKTVLVIDKYIIPSPLSGSNDYGQMIEMEYNDPVYKAMHIEAMEYWNGDASALLPRFMLNDVFSRCGKINIVSDTQNSYVPEKESLDLLQKEINTCNKIKEFKGDLTCNSRFPELSGGEVSNETLAFNPGCGMGFSHKSLIKIKKYCESLGIVFHQNDGVCSIRSGFVICDSGKKLKGSKILVTCGASTRHLLQSLEGVKVLGFSIGYIKLTDQEYEQLKDIPIIHKKSIGYLLPPDPETKTLKICATDSVVYDPLSNSTKPRYKKEELTLVPSIPIHSVVRIRTILSKYLPKLVFDRKGKLRDIINCKIYWVNNTLDSHFIIDRIPGLANVYIGCGGSGNEYTFLPNIGHYIKQRMENNLSNELCEKWAWKKNLSDSQTVDLTKNIKHYNIDRVSWYKERFGFARL